ncbi:MAG: amidase family protein [Planctomycetota bacterium]
MSDSNHPAVNAAIKHAARLLEQRGARVVSVDLPRTAHAICAYYIVAPAEASSNLARFDGVRYGHRTEHADSLEDLYVRSRTEGFGPEVKRRIMLGTHVLSSGYHDAFYHTAQRTRRLVKADFNACFDQDDDATGPRCHALLMPATPGPAFRLGEKTGDAMAMYLEDVYTVAVNLAGLPAISIPAAWTEHEGDTLPVGVQLIGPQMADEALLSIAHRLEAALAFKPSSA